MHADFRNVEPGHNIIPSYRNLDADSIDRLEQFVAEIHQQMDELRGKIERLEIQVARMNRKMKLLTALCLIVSGLSLLVAIL